MLQRVDNEAQALLKVWSLPSCAWPSNQFLLFFLQLSPSEKTVNFHSREDQVYDSGAVPVNRNRRADKILRVFFFSFLFFGLPNHKESN